MHHDHEEDSDARRLLAFDSVLSPLRGRDSSRLCGDSFYEAVVVAVEGFCEVVGFE